jgi:hypothetical protein
VEGDTPLVAPQAAMDLHFEKMGLDKGKGAIVLF